MKILIYDTETSGLYEPSMPSKHPDQPHIVQVAAQLVDAHCNVLEEFEAIVKPDGWTIPGEATEIHGITTERAMDEGFPEDEVLHQLLSMQSRASMRVGYNQPFDSRIVRIGLYRHARIALNPGLDPAYGHGIDDLGIPPDATDDELRELVADWWYYGVAQFDTMRAIASASGHKGRKYMKLAEAYEFCTGERMTGAHVAMNDVRATAKVLQYLLDHDHVRLGDEWIKGDLAFRGGKWREKFEARKRY